MKFLEIVFKVLIGVFIGFLGASVLLRIVVEECL